MINIDTRLLPQITPDQLYLLCHIVNFMNENRMCFPSNKKLIEQSGFSESKILRVKNELVSRKIISVKQRFRPDGSQTSNIYKIESDYIGVFVTGKNMSNLNTHPFTDEEGDPFTDKGGTPSVMNTLEVLAKRSINNIEVLDSSQTQFDTQNKDEIKNPFTRKKLDDLNARKEKEKEKSSAKKEKEKPEREPTELYQAYEIFCNFHESVSAAKYPRNFNGSFVMSSIDGRNIKLLLQWIKTVSADNPLDNFLAFIKGVWALQDKYINTNFNIGLIYRQSTALYARIQNQNPVLNKQRREEQLNEEAAEFLRKRYGIVN